MPAVVLRGSDDPDVVNVSANHVVVPLLYWAPFVFTHSSIALLSVM